MNIRERISIYFTDLTKTDKKNISRILAHPEFLIDKSAQEAAEMIETSPAALVRLAKKLGYKGLTDFKYSLEDHADNTEQLSSKQPTSLVNDVIDSYHSQLQSIEQSLDAEQIERIAQTILSKENIKVLGIGSSGLSAEQMVYLLLYQDKYAESIVSKTKMYYLSRVLTKNSLLIIYSVSVSKEYREIFTEAKKLGATTVLVTMNRNEKLKKLADELVILPSSLNFSKDENTLYQLDNRFMFNVFSEILASYINEKLK